MINLHKIKPFTWDLITVEKTHRNSEQEGPWRLSSPASCFTVILLRRDTCRQLSKIFSDHFRTYVSYFSLLRILKIIFSAFFQCYSMSLATTSKIMLKYLFPFQSLPSFPLLSSPLLFSLYLSSPLFLQSLIPENQYCMHHEGLFSKSYSRSTLLLTQKITRTSHVYYLCNPTEVSSIQLQLLAFWLSIFPELFFDLAVVPGSNTQLS